MTETEKIVTKLSKDFHVLKHAVEGNGTIEGSIIGRLSVLENNHKLILEKLDIIESKPCRTPCIFEEAEKMKEKRKAFRSADIANWIAVAGLAYLIIAGLL